MILHFYTIANADLGYGHLLRCIALITKAREVGVATKLVVDGDQGALSFLEKLQLEYTYVPISDFASTPATLPGVLVADFFYPEYFSLSSFRDDLGKLLFKFDAAVAIDGLGYKSLLKQWRKNPFDMVFLPYFLDRDYVSKKVINTPYLVRGGARFLILGADYDRLPRRKFRQLPKNILITCGGSDPTASSAEMIRAVQLLDKPLNVKVVVGPSFTEGNRKDIESAGKLAKLDITLIDRPNSLKDHFYWCDLAISASGLTKYELAVTGTPALLFSIDQLHHDINKSFISLGTALDLGVAPRAAQVATRLSALLGDFSMRRKLSDAGQRYFDNKGGERVVAEIIKLYQRLQR